jgi:hypothetical protein
VKGGGSHRAAEPLQDERSTTPIRGRHLGRVEPDFHHHSPIADAVTRKAGHAPGGLDEASNCRLRRCVGAIFLDDKALIDRYMTGADIAHRHEGLD